ncbi:hypothetical protein MED121_01455 [Marinomonas sp. MED121]|uniref:hypothetical protein n=1 Tax=Marinomonas sp. MED121 TaxID=314277 RepID=UPI0000690B9C|nr:hypothetical protein [Marinomonas sp. MED121]EAQ65836.1 hypothetical protein MED121_01455 [Marinomonas sp. MED121]
MEEKDVNQSVSGERHQIAGRDINNHASPEPEFDEGNPHKVSCPQCGRITGRFSAFCRNCDFEVKNYFDTLHIEERKAAINKERLFMRKAGGTFIGVGVLTIFVCNYFGVQSFDPYLYAFGGIGIGLFILNFIRPI